VLLSDAPLGWHVVPTRPRTVPCPPLIGAATTSPLCTAPLVPPLPPLSASRHPPRRASSPPAHWKTPEALRDLRRCGATGSHHEHGVIRLRLLGLFALIGVGRRLRLVLLLNNVAVLSHPDSIRHLHFLLLPPPSLLGCLRSLSAKSDHQLW
jgi:hypothetical protein